MRPSRHAGVVRPGSSRAFCLSTAPGPRPFPGRPPPWRCSRVAESRPGCRESHRSGAHRFRPRRGLRRRQNHFHRTGCGRFNALCADARGAVQRTLQRPSKRCAADRANSIFMLSVSALGRRLDRARRALHAALREHRRRRIATTFDNPQRGLNLVPRIATIELKKDGPDLAGGDWG
jgi:hypothetical protein